MPSAVVIIPAHNEAPRIANVIRSALDATQVVRVLVVDDGSTDGTESAARQAGAEVLRLVPNRGKGQAMLAGVRATHEPIVLFLDADLTGLTPGYVERLIRPVASGSCVMAVGLSEKEHIWAGLQEALPRISGQRAVLRAVLQQVPESFWHGFRIEVGINRIADKFGRTCDVTLFGVGATPKWSKGNVGLGLLNSVRMLRDVIVAAAEAERL
jgi:glycosyltransferase involved in cell wall biosynthesis